MGTTTEKATRKAHSWPELPGSRCPVGIITAAIAAVDAGSAWRDVCATYGLNEKTLKSWYDAQRGSVEAWRRVHDTHVESLDHIWRMDEWQAQVAALNAPPPSKFWPTSPMADMSGGQLVRLTQLLLDEIDDRLTKAHAALRFRHTVSEQLQLLEAGDADTH